MRGTARRTPTTVVAVVGTDAGDGVERLGVATNVVPAPDSDAAARMLPRLGTGAWWPDLDDLLGGIDQVVPDQMVPASAASLGGAGSARIA
jgi:hypothetical protein